MMRKNKLIILLLLVTIFAGRVNAQWIIENVPTVSTLNAIHMCNENHGWIVGDKGTMLFLHNTIWKNYPKVSNENLYSVFLNDENSGWTVGSRGTILYFNGERWENFPSPTNENLYSVSFSDSNHGVAVGTNGTIIVYENGIWNLIEKSTKGNFYTVSTKSDYSIIGGGLEYASIPVMTMLHTSKYKLNKTLDPNYILIRSLAIHEDDNIWAVGMPGAIFHFNGINWESLSQFKKLPSLKSIWFDDENKGISVGYRGIILTYSDDGWKEDVSPTKVRLNGATVVGNTYYAVGNNGTVVSMKHKSIGVPSPDSLISSFIKVESYPNPSTDKLNIIIPYEESFIPRLITIANIFGQIIYNENINPLTVGYIYEVNTSEFSTGVYLINISSSCGNNAAGKFIVRH